MSIDHIVYATPDPPGTVSSLGEQGIALIEHSTSGSVVLW